jgi:small conductance mechanosensitive channel
MSFGMFPLASAAEIFLMMRWDAFGHDRFLGKILDEWILDGQEFVHTKLPKLIVIACIAFFLNKILTIITSRMVRVAEQHSAGPGRLAEVRTLASVLRATGLAIIGLIAGLQFLDALGFNLSPLLASAGVAGVAIGLAAQNIVKDMFNGILILLEGQFNVGDTVRLAGLAGTVEAMTLRKTTVRDGDGTLYIIPHSQITTVAAAARNRDGRAQRQELQGRISAGSAGAWRGFGEGLTDDFSRDLQDARNRAVRSYARVPAARAVCA